MTSYEHVQIYKAVIKEYLAKKGMRDFKGFQVALSHDKPLVLKWEYPSNIEQPTVDFLQQEFKIQNIPKPGRHMKLELGYVYIHATEVAHTLLKKGLISKLEDAIYFNSKGEVVFPGTLVMTDTEAVEEFKTMTTIESILRIDLETTPNFYVNEDKFFKPKVTVDNGLLKYINQGIPQTTTGHIRVLIAYQKIPTSKKASEFEKVGVASTSSVYGSSNINDAMKGFRHIIGND